MFIKKKSQTLARRRCELLNEKRMSDFSRRRVSDEHARVIVKYFMETREQKGAENFNIEGYEE